VIDAGLVVEPVYGGQMERADDVRPTGPDLYSGVPRSADLLTPEAPGSQSAAAGPPLPAIIRRSMRPRYHRDA